MASQLTVYPVGAYTFGSKPAKFEKDAKQRLERMKEKYAQQGARRSVDAVLVVHEHGHPHILMIQMGASFFRLPGGRLRPGEDEVEGLMRKLNGLLAPPTEAMRPDWRPADLLGTWWRPNFDNHLYPYCPPHVARPKEVKRLFLVALPEKCYLAVPKNLRLLAVPLFEVYDNAPRYGPVIAALPALLSRFTLTLAGRPPAAAPNGGAAAPGAAAGGVVVPPAAAAQAAAVAQQLVQFGQQQQQAAQAAAAAAQQRPGSGGGGGITVSLAGQQQPAQAQQQPAQQQQQQQQQHYPQQQQEGELFVDFDE